MGFCKLLQSPSMSALLHCNQLSSTVSKKWDMHHPTGSFMTYIGSDEATAIISSISDKRHCADQPLPVGVIRVR